MGTSLRYSLATIQYIYKRFRLVRRIAGTAHRPGYLDVSFLGQLRRTLILHSFDFGDYRDAWHWATASVFASALSLDPGSNCTCRFIWYTCGVIYSRKVIMIDSHGQDGDFQWSFQACDSCRHGRCRTSCWSSLQKCRFCPRRDHNLVSRYRLRLNEWEWYNTKRWIDNVSPCIPLEQELIIKFIMMG